MSECACNVPEASRDAAQPQDQACSGPCFRPNVDILERQDELVILADVPGARADGVEVSFEYGLLEIRARVAPQATSRRWLLNEYGSGGFYRAFRVGEEVDAARIVAELKDGVLAVRIPKASGRLPRRIQVRSN